jgi:Spx/MgsR family transcriptional regulator
MKKARTWLDSHGVEYAFHDYKVSGIDRATLEQWCKRVGWEVLLNRAGTTFRKLSEGEKQINGANAAIALMAAQPSMIKRPVLATAHGLLVGFKPEIYEGAFKALGFRAPLTLKADAAIVAHPRVARPVATLCDE